MKTLKKSRPPPRQQIFTLQAAVAGAKKSSVKNKCNLLATTLEVIIFLLKPPRSAELFFYRISESATTVTENEWNAGAESDSSPSMLVC